MSISGRSGKILRKVDLVETKSLVKGITRVVFYHKADLGDEGINLSSLVMPTEVSSLGDSNPSPSQLLEARLFSNKENLTLVSSFRGILQKGLSYRVASNSQIVFVGFTAEDGEIFTGTIDTNTTNNIQVIDAKQQTAEGDLDPTETDFAIGFSTRTAREEVLVTRNGLVQKRNTNNSDTVLDGNYYIVDAGSGYGSVVRFNVPAGVSADYIKVTSLGNIVESPTNSTWDEIEKLQGQIDSMVPVLAAVSGLDETDFQATPNNMDLRQFGERVLGLEEPGSPGVPLQATVSTAGALKKNKIQTKILPSGVSADGTIAALTFNNLVVGNWYEVTGHFYFIMDVTVADGTLQVIAVNNSQNINITRISLSEAVDTVTDDIVIPVSFKFQAAASTLTFVAGGVSANSPIAGDGTRTNTYIQLEERNDLEATTDFT